MRILVLTHEACLGHDAGWGHPERPERIGAVDGDVVGELAESWEVSPDATEWVFKLRKGVEFHDGKTLDAEDVVHSINVHRGEDSRSIGAGLVTAIDEVKSDGKN